MKIEKIKKLNNSKYQIVLENGEKIIAYDEAIINNNILYKKELTREEINNLSKKNNYYNCYNSSIKYLTRSVRSEKDFDKFLEKFELNSEEKCKIRKELKSIGLLDDLKFASSFIHDKFNLNDYGPLKLRKELKEHNIDDEIINLEISKIEENEISNKAQKIIGKKLKTLKGSNYSVKQKLYIYMNNLGYKKEYVDIYFDAETDDSKMLESDYDKIYVKLSKKDLSNDELCFKIKQKLYQKGYSLSKIEEIIEKKRS